jgi:hypothetical protein
MTVISTFNSVFDCLYFFFNVNFVIVYLYPPVINNNASIIVSHGGTKAQRGRGKALDSSIFLCASVPLCETMRKGEKPISSTSSKVVLLPHGAVLESLNAIW